MITYNHERYIAEAMDGVLRQEVSFPYELIVSEDFSTDGTRDILLDYERRHPEKIRLIFSDRNLNSNRVFTRAVAEARGEYIAMLDGDDWWTSPQKLAKQVGMLEEDPAAAMCFHNVNVVYEDGATRNHAFHLQDPKHRLSAPTPAAHTGLDELVQGNYIQTCSVLFRAGALTDIPDWYFEAPLGDWPLYVLLAEHGHVIYLDEVMASYRVHAGGIWSSRLSLYRDVDDIKKILGTFEAIDRHLAFQRHQEIARSSNYLRRLMVTACLQDHEVMLALRYWREYARVAGRWNAVADRGMWADAVSSLMPGKVRTKLARWGRMLSMGRSARQQ
jgi:glycosyltransferase involved in cell wall biosynthesis